MSIRAASPALRSCAAPSAPPPPRRRNPSPAAPRPLQLGTYPRFPTPPLPLGPTPILTVLRVPTGLSCKDAKEKVKGVASKLAGSCGLKRSVHDDTGGRGVYHSPVGLTFPIPPPPSVGMRGVWCNFCGFQQLSSEPDSSTPLTCDWAQEVVSVFLGLLLRCGSFVTLTVT